MGSHSEIITSCFNTQFLSRFDELKEAKRRYRKNIEKIGLSHNVVFASEQALIIDQKSILFDLLIDEVKGFGDPLSAEEQEQYAVFLFSTIIRTPNGGEEALEIIHRVADDLELDDLEEWPPRFPSRTRSIMMSPPDALSEGCIYE